MVPTARRLWILQDFAQREGGLHQRLPLDGAKWKIGVIDSRMRRAYGTTWEKVRCVWPGYASVAWRGFWTAGRHDVVLARHGAIGLFFAALKRLFARRGPRLLVIGYIYAQRPGLAGMLRRWFFRWSTRAVDTVIVGSGAEIETYQRQLQLPPDKLVALPPSMYAMPLLSADETAPYVLAAGRSLRDYATLVEAAKELPMRVVIIAGADNIRGLNPPPHVELREGIYGDAFCEAVARSTLVVVPLSTAEVAAGQMVVLQAMAARRAVVATDTPCLREYITPGRNGLLVPLRDAAALRSALLRLLADPAERERLAQAGYETWRDTFSDDAYAERLAGLIDALPRAGENAA